METKAALWRERKKKELRLKCVWAVRREHLAKDVLWEVHRSIQPGWMIYRSPGDVFTTSFVGEDAKDHACGPMFGPARYAPLRLRFPSL